MAISYENIRDERQWRASTGLTEEQFIKLAESFKLTYEDLLGESILDRQTNSGTEARFTTYKDLLFFILYSIKSGLTYDLLGLSFNLNRGNAFRQQTTGIRILEMTLHNLDMLPKRFYESLEEFKEDLKGEDELLLDGLEQLRQRPVNHQDQKDDYSGKKKPIL